MHMYNFLCSDSLLYFFLFLSTLHSVYTRDCSSNRQQEISVEVIVTEMEIIIINPRRACAGGLRCLSATLIWGLGLVEV